MESIQSVSTYPPLNNGNEILISNAAKADLFNEYFLSHSRLDDGSVNLPNDPIILPHSLANITVTEQDVIDQIRSIDLSKATGPDMISPKMLKESDYAIVPSLCRVFNMSLFQQRMPQI